MIVRFTGVVDLLAKARSSLPWRLITELPSRCPILSRRSPQAAELRTLLRWARSPEPAAVLLVTGPPNTGKTCLTYELDHRLTRRGWTIQYIRNDDDARAAARKRVRRLFLVVDDADTFPGLRSLLLEVRDATHGRTRVLLIARSTSLWRDRLEHGTPALRDLLTTAPVLELPIQDPPRHPVPDATALLSGTSPYPGEFTNDVVTATLLGEIERRSEPGVLTSRAMDETAVARALADSPRFAERVTTGLRPEQAVLAARVLARIASAGPERETSDAVAAAYQRVTRQLPDDAETLATFACHPQYLTGPFMDARARMAERALLLLDDDPDRQAALHVLIADADKYDGRYAEAVTAADQALRILADTDRAHDVDPAVATVRAQRGTLLWFRGRLDEALDDETAALRTFRALVARNPERYRAPLAQSLMNVGSTMADLGRHQEALAAAHAGVDAARAVARETPEQIRPLLAKGLWNLGKRLAESGDTTQAHQYTIESVETCRELVRQDPYRYTPDLASALSYLGARLSELGRLSEAARATAEALELRRRLADQHDGYLPFVAQTLSNLGIMNAQLGRQRLGLEREREAVAIRRRLAASNPDRHLPELAASLSNLGVTHSVLGNATQALAAEDEAAGILRELSAEHPQRHLPGLVTSLSNLASRLAENGRVADAVDPATEAVAASRRLAETHRGRHLPALATSLTNLAGTYADVGRYEDAVEPATEAVVALSDLVRSKPEKYEPELALALTNLAVALAGAGQRLSAIDAARQAAGIRARLAQQNPPRFQEWAERSAALVAELEGVDGPSTGRLVS